MSIIEQYRKLRDFVLGMEKDAEKADKGTNTAKVRIRKNCREVVKFCKELKVSTETVVE